MKTTTNGKTTRAIKPAAKVADLRDEVSVFKRILVERHVAEARAKLRAGFVSWHAHLLAELDHLDHEFADEDSELYAAFGADEAGELRRLMSELWSLAAGVKRPKVVPAFLATSTVTLPKA